MQGCCFRGVWSIFCYKMQYNPYIDFVNDMVAKRDLYNKQGKDLLQTLFKKNY